MAMPDARLDLETALALHAAGRYAEIEARVALALAAGRVDADLLNVAAVAAMALGRADRAEYYWRRALEGDAGHAEAHYNLGTLLNRQGRVAEAEAALRAALRLRPDYPEACNNLGQLLNTSGRVEEAEAIYRQALALRPDYARASDNLGALLLKQRRFAEAEALYRHALRTHPDDATSLGNLALLSAERGDLGEAEATYRQALRAHPKAAALHNNLGSLLFRQQRFVEAEAAYRQAVALKPDYAVAWCNLGALLQDQGDGAAAEQAYRVALAQRPGYAEAHNNLGTLHLERTRYADAQAEFQRALACDPNYAHAASLAYHCAAMVCDWDTAESLAGDLTRLVMTGVPGAAPFALLGIADNAAELQYRAGRLYGEEILAHARPVARTASPGDGRLRIGYLSADFHEHATLHLLSGVLASHDRRRYAIHAYAYGARRDARSAEVAAACEAYRDLDALGDAAAAERIAADGIDILVDLKGYTQGSRLGICARRPAPVQVAWLGYPATLGAAGLADYLIGDAIVTPAQRAADFSETLALLPRCYQPNDRRRPRPEAPDRASQGLPEAALVFCAFNQSYKINRRTFGLWREILGALPDSLLWLLQPPPEAVERLRASLAAGGIDPRRLRFAPPLPQAAHMARLGCADLALDTFPVTSHTTGSDALWAGVPLISRRGDTMVSRVAASLLGNVGLDELVCADDAAYVELAVALGRDPARRAELRRRLRAARDTAPLFDTETFTRDLEGLYDRIWAAHRAGRRDSPV
jgi:predicted O-linked N-acetylglucosamine transferase (SPINDLY family)